MFTDSHCHLASAQFSGQLPELLDRAAAAQVTRILTVGTEPGDWLANLQLAQASARTAANSAGTTNQPEIRAALGLHPCSVDQAENLPALMALLTELARQPEVLAIGETGLDFFHPPPSGWSEAAWHDRQRESLRAHFELAATLQKPIVLHTRDRQGQRSLLEAIDLSREFQGRVRAQFHCHLGPWTERSDEIIQLGGIVSFGGIASFPSARETTLAAAVAAQAGTFALETDAPYLAPVPHRGQRNEPAFVADTTAAIAAARGEEIEELAAHTSRTAAEFFRWE